MLFHAVDVDLLPVYIVGESGFSQQALHGLQGVYVFKRDSYRQGVVTHIVGVSYFVVALPPHEIEDAGQRLVFKRYRDTLTRGLGNGLGGLEHGQSHCS